MTNSSGPSIPTNLSVLFLVEHLIAFDISALRISKMERRRTYFLYVINKWNDSRLEQAAGWPAFAL